MEKVDKKTLEFLLKTSNEMLEEKKEKISWVSLASFIYGLMAMEKVYSSPNRFLYGFPLHSIGNALCVKQRAFPIEWRGKP
ncbi:MAG: hypothetical protein J7L59_00940 [Nanoarchaeota archaeon]|nr:hypothetical protein [Nanoarchaeota archaeon]